MKQISAETTLPSDVMFNSVLATRKITSDLIILQASMLVVDTDKTTEVNPKNFVPFSAEKLQALLGERVTAIDYYVVEGYTVGIYLNNADGSTKNNNFSTFYTGKECCVLFFCNESVNLGALYGVGEPSNTSAIDLLAYLLAEKK